MIPLVDRGDTIKASLINSMINAINGTGIPSNGPFMNTDKGTLYYSEQIYDAGSGGGGYEGTKFLAMETRTYNELTSRTLTSSDLSDSYNYYFVNLGTGAEGSDTAYGNLVYNGNEVKDVVFVNYVSACLDGLLMSSDFYQKDIDGNPILSLDYDGYVNTGCDNRRCSMFGLFLDCVRMQELSIEISGQISVVTVPAEYPMYCITNNSWKGQSSEPGHPEGPQVNELCARINDILSVDPISNLIISQVQQIVGHTKNLSSGSFVLQTIGSQFITKKGSEGFEHQWMVDAGTGLIERAYAMVGTYQFHTGISATTISGLNYCCIDMEELSGEMLSAPYEDATHCSFLIFDWDQANLTVKYYDIYPKVNSWERYTL